MLIETSRFGPVDVDDGRVITFEKGLLGFGGHTRFVLLQPGDEGYFFWLQSVQTAELAFVVTDPSLFVADYTVPLREDQMKEMGIASVDSAQVFVIVNKRGTTLTGNLQGPLVISTANRTGEQLVLSDKRFHTRVPLVELGEPAKATA
jgi:flagellar assembly factor FliW